jgi:hypothetical protein
MHNAQCKNTFLRRTTTSSSEPSTPKASPFPVPHNIIPFSAMSKRQADTYLTKEPRRNRPDEDDDFESERDKIDPVQIASEEVMATRK